MSDTALQIADTPHVLDLSQYKIGKPTRRDAKLTKRKRYQFLQHFAKDYNFTKAAHAIGVTRRAVYDLLEKDSEFKAAFDEIDNAVLDTVESASMTVAIQPSREGFNDRKLLLQSRRPEIYGNKQEITSHVKVESVIAVADVRNILSSYDAIDAEIVDSE